MITQRFGFRKEFTKKWNNSVYSRLSKILCEFKEQVRARPSGEKCGIEVQVLYNRRHGDAEEYIIFVGATVAWHCLPYLLQIIRNSLRLRASAVNIIVV